MHNILILGCSGHAKVIIDIIEREQRYQIAGLIDPHTSVDSQFSGYPVLGDDNQIPTLIESHNIKGFIVAIGDNYTRQSVFTSVIESNPGLVAVNAIHPTAVIGRHVTLGEGTIIMAGSIINPETHVGRGCIINTRASIDHDSNIGDFSSLAPGVICGGACSIGFQTALGLGAIVKHGTHIGDQCVVGASALVLSDLPPLTLAYGSPAKIIRSRKAEEPYL